MRDELRWQLSLYVSQHVTCSTHGVGVDYSVDMNSAWLVVQYLRAFGYQFTLMEMKDQGWLAEFDAELAPGRLSGDAAACETPQDAILVAALATVAFGSASGAVVRDAILGAVRQVQGPAAAHWPLPELVLADTASERTVECLCQYDGMCCPVHDPVGARD